MTKRPHLGNSNVNLQGFMQNGQAVSMALTGWINAAKESENDPQVRGAIEQISQLMQQYNLSIGLQISARTGGEPRDWPRIGSWRLFTNKPRDQQQRPAYNQAPQGYQSAPQGYGQPQQQPAGSFDDEIPF